MLKPNKHGCPPLHLAPMEGVGDRAFRKAIRTIGGFDEAVRDFIRVPKDPHIPSIAKAYQFDELGDVPLAAQLMGSDPEHMAAMAVEMVKRGARRIDINCGCPSNTVTGRGAGSSLLKEPRYLFEVAGAVVKAVDICVTLKMRSGFDDTSLFEENLLAAQESGVRYITVHPRTKIDGYGPPARWDLIAKAKQLLKIPVVGNGDILFVDDVIRMVETTRCDGVMIGRGSVINPFIFQEIKAHFAGREYTPNIDDLLSYLDTYRREMDPLGTERARVGKLKQLMGFLFKKNGWLLARRSEVLTAQYTDFESLLSFIVPLLHEGWSRR